MISLGQNRVSKIFMLSALFIILGLLLWNTTVFFERLKEVERDKMQIWAQSQKTISTENENDYLELNLMILTSNNKIPLVNVDLDETINFHRNISEKITSSPKKMAAYIQILKAQNDPIVIKLPDNRVQLLYYGNSTILSKLKYYPIAIVVVVLLLIGMVYFFFNTSKISEQNKLWAGMAKETAHQIGTPLSSLVGWLEILKTENLDQDYVMEMAKDINRLKMITERFSKVGSVPTLELANIVSETNEAYEYLKSRSSKLINFDIQLPEKSILVKLNKPLFAWTIENLVKNAIDAMKGKGDLKIEVVTKKQYVKIRVIDSGSGISKRNFQKVFEPGYTSKTRGWGLGLSLAKRIILDYHGGRIKVSKSEIDKGTTFEISLLQC